MIYINNFCVGETLSSRDWTSMEGSGQASRYWDLAHQKLQGHQRPQEHLWYTSSTPPSTLFDWLSSLLFLFSCLSPLSLPLPILPFISLLISCVQVNSTRETRTLCCGPISLIPREISFLGTYRGGEEGIAIWEGMMCDWKGGEGREERLKERRGKERKERIDVRGERRGERIAERRESRTNFLFKGMFISG